VGGLWLALGRYGGLYGIVSALPFIQSFRCPCRHIVLFQLGLAIGGAVAWKEFAQRSQDRSRFAWRTFMPFLVLAIAGWLAAAMLLALRNGWAGIEEPKVLQLYLDRNSWVLLAAFVPTVTCGLALIALRGSRLVLAGMLVFGLLDQAAFGYLHIWQTPQASLEAFTTQTNNVAIEPGQRVYAARNNWTLFNDVNNAEGYIGPRLVRLLSYGYQVKDVLRLAGVRWTCKARWPVRGTPPKWRPVEDPMPYVRCVTQVRLSENPMKDLPKTDIRAVALLDREIRLPVSTPGTATVVDRIPTRIHVRCETPANQLLIIAESFNNGWHASIDNREQPILRAYGDFMACEVPAGVHDVILDFSPQSLDYGKRISFLSLCIIVLLYFIYKLGMTIRSERARLRNEQG